MSEYQYYEFQAIDRPLTEEQMEELRSYSTRATITRTSFVNDYSWGSFKGDADVWMEKYFDAFLLIATKQPNRYDEAVRLLLDLRDLAQRQGRDREFSRNLNALYLDHARKPSFTNRLHKAGL